MTERDFATELRAHAIMYGDVDNYLFWKAAEYIRTLETSQRDIRAQVWNEAMAAINEKWLEGVYNDGQFEGLIDQHQVIRVGRMKNPYEED